jgi:hypothetical protein
LKLPVAENPLMAAMACGENPEKGEENDMQYF